MKGTQLAGLVVLGLVLFATVGAANVVTTAERTALDGEYAEQTMRDSNAYDGIRNATIDKVLECMESANLSEGQKLLQAGNGTDNRTLVADAVTEDYIEDEGGENIRELFAYLNGEESRLNMDIDLRQLKGNLADSFANQMSQKNMSVLVEEFAPEDTPVPVDGELVETMRSGPEGYEQARLDFRVDVGWEVTDNDEKLYLIGENPRQYSEREKEQIVQEREQEIRDAIRQEVQDDTSTLSARISREVDSRRDDAKDRICEETVADLEPDAGQRVCRSYYQPSSDNTHLDNATHAAVQLQYVIVDGLTRDKRLYNYEEFDSDLTESERQLTNETADLAESRIETEVPDTLDAKEQFGADTVNKIEDARGTVGTINLLNLLLPIGVVVLIGLAYGVTRSVETTATFTGIVFALVGGLHLIVATVLGGTILSAVEDAVKGSGASEFADLALALVKGMLATLATQSLGLLVVGVLLIALAYASKNGHLDALKARASAVGGGNGGQPPRQTQGHQPEQGQRQAGQQGGQHGQSPQGSQQGQSQQGDQHDQ